ncbi:hypothetical protein BJ508DRAFT_141085 [Ascobolus immersus RN42]|uniref:Uncharacterized protein n=1 Tax=Ascobolus immersus RN42 TaxID=1160509 RepID=A0A3N4I0C1_ASCIM|nr:hypothetical protein BJ508DRAFT_141085 [Ascobolus immersus RN42]
MSSKHDVAVIAAIINIVFSLLVFINLASTYGLHSIAGVSKRNGTVEVEDPRNSDKTGSAGSSESILAGLDIASYRLIQLTSLVGICYWVYHHVFGRDKRAWERQQQAGSSLESIDREM